MQFDGTQPENQIFNYRARVTKLNPSHKPSLDRSPNHRVKGYIAITFSVDGPVSMGYTHYWKDVSAEVVTRTIVLCRPLIEVAGEQGDIGNGEGLRESAPYISENDPAIIFNGRVPYDHETFALIPCAFGFCKTNQKPYDALVVADLVVAAHHGAKVITDGDEGDWETGIEIAQGLTDETLNLSNITFELRRLNGT